MKNQRGKPSLELSRHILYCRTATTQRGPDCMPASSTILITTLAEYQTRFWIPVAQRLQGAGRKVHLVAFDDRSAEMAQAKGVAVTNIYRTGLAGGAAVDDPQAFAARIAEYGLDGTNFLFSHERVTFGIRDGAALRRRFMIYSNAMERVLDDLAARGQPCVMVQELGGFLSVIAAFYAIIENNVHAELFKLVNHSGRFFEGFSSYELGEYCFFDQTFYRQTQLHDNGSKCGAQFHERFVAHGRKEKFCFSQLFIGLVSEGIPGVFKRQMVSVHYRWNVWAQKYENQI